MDRHKLLNIIALYRESLESQGVKIDRIILDKDSCLPSMVHGEDIDIVVVSEDFRGKAVGERIDHRAMALYDLFRPVDAVPMTPEEWQSSAPAMGRFTAGEVIV